MEDFERYSMAKPPRRSSPTTTVMRPQKASVALQNPLVAAVNALNFDPTQDTYKINGAAGIATISIKKPTGEVYSAHVNGVAFQQFTVFDPASISVADRRRLEFDLVNNKKLSQSEAGNLLGIPQSLISKDLKIMKSENDTKSTLKKLKKK